MMTGTARAAVGLLFLAELAAAFLQAPVGAGAVALAQARQPRVKGNGRTCLRMSNVKGVARNEDILNVVQLAKKPLPNRPDGVVVCVQYSSSEDFGCKATDDEFDRLSEKMLDCIFLRCYREYEGSAMTMALRDVTLMPTFEVFYRGDAVCKIAGPLSPRWVKSRASRNSAFRQRTITGHERPDKAARALPCAPSKVSGTRAATGSMRRRPNWLAI